MKKNILTVVIGGIAVIGAVTAAGYYLGNIVGKPKNTALNTTPSPSVEPTATTTPSPSLLPTIPPSVAPSLLPTAPPQKATVKAAATSIPKATPTEEISIRFVDLPSKVNSGESFNVSWYVSGPEGKTGTYTKVSTSRKVGTSDGTSSSYSSSETSQSFGKFILPQKFDSKMSFSGNSGDIEIKAIAEIDGKAYTTTRTISLN